MHNSEQPGEIGAATDALVGLLAEKLAPLVSHELSRLVSHELSGEVAALVAEKLADLHEHREAGPEVMNAKEAAAFLGVDYGSFKNIAPGLPRHALRKARYVYLRSELIEWLLSR